MTNRRTASTVLVASNEDLKVIDHRTKERSALVAKLNALTVPAASTTRLPVDIVWTVDGHSWMFDLKSIEDVVASVDDGRLHAQMTAMQAREPECFGLLIEGGFGDGVVVGRGPSAWPVERVDNLLLSLQMEGAVILHSPSKSRTAERLASLWNWSRKDTHGSWHRPQKKQHAMHDVYTDKTWRAVVEFLMGMPGMGETNANALIDRWPLADILGVTPEGLRAAKERWLAVKGIGGKTAETWGGFLSEDFSSPLIRGGAA
jgi:ERCC4-type nuclease